MLIRSLLSRISLRTLVPLAMVVPVLVVVAAVGAIVWFNGRAAAADLERQIFDQTDQRITQRLSEFVEQPRQINQLNAHLIREGLLDPTDLRSWQNTLLEQVNAFRTISSIGFASVNKDTNWMVRYPDRDVYEWGIRDAQTNGDIVEVLIDPVSGETVPDTTVRYAFDPHVRPWYIAALEKPGQQVWSEVYLWASGRADHPELGLGLVLTIHDKRGDLLGVHDTELGISQISQFLADLQIGTGGTVYIVDDELGMIATSTLTPLATAEGKRLNATELDDPRARAIASRMQQQNSDLNRAEDFSLDADREHLRVRVVPFQHETGLDWTIWIALPADTLLANTFRARRQMISAGLIATITVVLVGFILALGGVRTLMQLVEQVRAMGRGDFSQTTDIQLTRELGRLSRALNDFSHDLQDRLRLKQSMALAIEVQQNLLPETTPRVDGLDISTHSVFCDETGGDYYDYLPITDPSGSSLSLTIGDVTGHGVGAALLMATARGALRSRATEEPSLSKLLAHTNAMLFFDTRGVTFMTMLLLSIDGQSRSLRWASAGHLPPLVYTPSTDRFTDLESGTLPLGVMEHASYTEQLLDHLEPGTVIVACTDGIWECQNEAGVPFGLDRLRDLIREHAALGSDEISGHILNALALHRAQKPLSDDLSLIVVKMAS